MTAAQEAVGRLLQVAGIDEEDLLSQLTLHQHGDSANDSALRSSFPVSLAAQATIAASALAATHLYQVRGGGKEKKQSVSVNQRHASLDFASEKFCVIDGKEPAPFWDPLAGTYETKDGHVRLHTNFPHHRSGIIKLLSCGETREDVASALQDWTALEFEQAAVDRGLCVAALRSFEEWNAHPQAHALKNTPPLSILKIANTPSARIRKMPEHALGALSRPLEGIRVLELTRVLAGPICGRTLAAHGADVLWITSPSLPDLPSLDADTSRGKRTTQLDLTLEKDRDQLVELIKDADVFLQSYRPGALAAKGFSVEDVARIKPGIVYASVRAYGWEGPWKDRRGFDSLVQTATGFNVDEADAYNVSRSQSSILSPSSLDEREQVPLKPLPVQVLDHGSGQLLALGVMSALARTFTEGGTYEVRVSLAATGNFLRSLPRISPSIAFGPSNSNIQRLPKWNDDEITGLSDDIPFDANTSKRTLRALRHAAVLSETPVRIGNAPNGLNSHPAEWLPRLES